MSEQFTISPGFRAWCNLCNVGFNSLEESQEHNKKELKKHQDINAQRGHNAHERKKGTEDRTD